MHVGFETLGLLVLGFVIVFLFCLIVIIRLWVKTKSKAFGWFLAQMVLLIVASLIFFGVLAANSSISMAMTSEENSIALGAGGVLWAFSMICMIMGISRLSKEKSGVEEQAWERGEYNAGIKKVLGMLVFYAVLCPLVPLILSMIASKSMGFSQEDPLVYVVTTFAGLGLLLLWLKKKYILNLKSMFSVKKVSAFYFIPMAITILGSGIILSEADNFLTRIIPMSDFWIKTFNTLMGENFAPWKAILAVVVTAPIVEEIIFRGLILRSFLKHYSVRKSIILSALLFGIIHMNPWQFVSAFAGGLILGWLYVKTDSIIPSIFGHALNNGMSFIIGAIGLSIPGYNAAYEIANHQPLWFDFLGVILLAGGISWLLKLFNARQTNAGSTIISSEENSL